MDNDLESFEAELARLLPAEPSPGLKHRIALALEPSSPSRVHWWLVAAALPIAAAVLLLALAPRGGLLVERSPAGGVAANDVLKPVSAENILYSAAEEGLVTLDDGTPARRERLKYVDTIFWQNPRTHASLTWSVPREEVRVVPIRYQ